MQLHLASLWGPVSMSLAASSYRDVPHWQSHAVNPGLWVYLPGGQILRAMWQYELNSYGPELSDERYVWRVGAGVPANGQSPHLLQCRRAGQSLDAWIGELSLLWATGRLDFTADVNVTTGRITGGIALQVNTPVAALAVRSHRTGQEWVHAQSLHGQVSVDRRLALGSDVHQESAARLIIFSDTNSNGIADPDETLLPHIRVQMYHANWVRHADGTLHAGHLEPFKTYQVRILEGSVTDPRLQPATGYSFSFVADPGQTKRIYVPMQPLLQISGRIINPDRPSSRFLVRVADGPGVSVYRDGGFTLMLKAGDHEVSVVDVLTDEVLAKQQVRVHAQSDIITIDLTKGRSMMIHRLVLVLLLLQPWTAWGQLYVRRPLHLDNRRPASVEWQDCMQPPDASTCGEVEALLPASSAGTYTATVSASPLISGPPHAALGGSHRVRCATNLGPGKRLQARFEGQGPYG